MRTPRRWSASQQRSCLWWDERAYGLTVGSGRGTIAGLRSYRLAGERVRWVCPLAAKPWGAWAAAALARRGRGVVSASAAGSRPAVAVAVAAAAPTVR